MNPEVPSRHITRHLAENPAPGRDGGFVVMSTIAGLDRFSVASHREPAAAR